MSFVLCFLYFTDLHQLFIELSEELKGNNWCCDNV
jgi:hypothetical protein